MALPRTALIDALRQTANRLSLASTRYQWSSFAYCNCGHLAQTLTGMTAPEIRSVRMREEGDWGQQAIDRARGTARMFPDYGDRPALDEGAWEPENVGACLVSGAPVDELFEQMYQAGLTPEDVAHLERLSDPNVRRRLGTNTQRFACFERANVVRYLRAWADILEEALPLGRCDKEPLIPQAAE